MAITNKNQALSVGFKLQDYTITRVLSSGGFSFVYLAHDPNKKVVAIKEFMPNGLALRIQWRYRSTRPTRRLGLVQTRPKKLF
jgi:serine/threonine protein kinase